MACWGASKRSGNPRAATVMLLEARNNAMSIAARRSTSRAGHDALPRARNGVSTKRQEATARSSDTATMPQRTAGVCSR